MLKPYKRAEIQFREIREIGHDGKNSKVHLVHDHQLDAEIVIKKKHKKDIDSTADFFAESKILYKSRHTNVVDIHYACEDSDYIYIAMPFYTHGSMKQLIDGRYLTVREILNFAIQFLQGLHNIHSKRLIHFDIKPDNLMIGDNGEILLSDFGQAKLTNTIGIAGHDRLYVKQRPPEAFDHDHFDLRYDIYQVGMTLYRMSNGNAIFYDQYNKYTDPTGKYITERDKFKFDVKNGNFPDRDGYLPHIPKKLKKIINTCLSCDPDDRYQNCLELSNNLAQIDHALDWHYEEDKSNNIQTWRSDRDDRLIELKKDQTGYSAIKIMKQSGNTQRIRAYCKENLTQNELHSFFKEI